MKKYKIKKQMMTLMEVLIASFLAMILLTAVTTLYRQAVLIGKESEKIAKEQFKIAYLEKKLFSCFTKTVTPRASQGDFAFFTMEGSFNKGLVFTYDRAVDLNPEFSNHCLAKLYVDDSKNLTLAIWPSPKRWKEPPNPALKKEVLLSDVVSLNFEFYVPPKRDRSLVTKARGLEEIQPENSWHKAWKASYHQLPALIKIFIIQSVNGKETHHTFAFPFPESDFQIMYEN